MDSIDKLAKKIADLHNVNRNPPSTAPRIGTVADINPLKIQWGDHIILAEGKLFIPKIYREGYMIPNRYQATDGSMVEETILWKIDLAVGDKVIIIPDENLKMWYIVDAI
ncbi:DUF2577 family protein [Paenibacillus validus]|uniref:DUF2577 family protein n=1 Tax=Paenibacillus validus TaxID=44253 RepID=UPI000FD76361|nr:DUF2577 family protein [Paenibacillus validus]MED4599865.1 DUF2577 family protein [Paenibacillus validus]MED4606102.1 DUF2577 family protein [Paenibacillus validus]